MKDGYAVITAPMDGGRHHRLECRSRPARQGRRCIASDRGRVALRYGPLVYNIESVDQNIDGVLKPDAVLTPEWNPDLLDGVVVIRGQFADGSPLTAVPNYARNNRGGRSIVWIRDGR